MPIAINGSGTVTGISVGGLPDGIVVTDMLAADSVTAPKCWRSKFYKLCNSWRCKIDDTDGGTFTSGAWRTRDLNTEIADLMVLLAFLAINLPCFKLVVT